MKINFKSLVFIIIILFMQITLFAQKDVTQFLGIPVDGYKSEMLQKLKEKGFTSATDGTDLLVGEFNGKDVYLSIVTNNNKIWRIGVAYKYPVNETDIRIEFNNLIRQFQNNKKYIALSNSNISELSIPEDEDLSYEMSIHNKRYQAVFYQKTADYDSLNRVKDLIMAKESLNEEDKKQLIIILAQIQEELNNCFKKNVWFTISENSGKYVIMILYDNEYNKDDGENL